MKLVYEYKNIIQGVIPGTEKMLRSLVMCMSNTNMIDKKKDDKFFLVNDNGTREEVFAK
ncbi:MAG: hypothetical protein [Bacteriophage sp.]|jgi:hypothetical protein|nr:MAG: hypothetical protein [Bacteriophage sp.]